MHFYEIAFFAKVVRVLILCKRWEVFFKLSIVGMIINYSLRQMSQSKSISCSHFLLHSDGFRVEPKIKPLKVFAKRLQFEYKNIWGTTDNNPCSTCSIAPKKTVTVHYTTTCLNRYFIYKFFKILWIIKSGLPCQLVFLFLFIQRWWYIPIYILTFPKHTVKIRVSQNIQKS